MAEIGTTQTTVGVPEHIPYKITSQEKTSTLTPGGGGFQEVWRVTFEAPNGVHSFIEVPVTEWSSASVDAKIEEELETIMSIHELGPEPHPDNLAE